MEKIVTENLFLLEFLVDRCVLLPCAVKDIENVVGETCISFKFLDNIPLDVCEEDFSPSKQNYNDDGAMKSGKSCLFALSPEQAEECCTIFDVDVLVFKKCASRTLPDKVQVGVSIIPVVTVFQELIELLQSGAEAGTVCKTLKDCYQILSVNGEVIGSVSVFLRMSCFGKLIVTQFQMNLEDKSVFFKDKEGKSLYKYRKASRGEVGKGCKPLRAQSAASCCQEQGMDGRCEDCTVNAPGYGGDVPRLPPCNDINAAYQEIGAEMNGNALTIRVHKNKANVKRVDDNDSECCYCLGGHDKQQRQSQGTNPCYCLKPIAPCCGPPCADKQVLSLKPADDPNNPFAFRVSGCPNAVNNNVTVVSPTNTRPDGMQVTEISDPHKDVFVLRIGKKSEGTDRKANLELELVTPKGIDRKPPPKKETRETQFLESDCPGKKKKKKKKKKGGCGDGEYVQIPPGITFTKNNTMITPSGHELPIPPEYERARSAPPPYMSLSPAERRKVLLEKYRKENGGGGGGVGHGPGMKEDRMREKMNRMNVCEPCYEDPCGWCPPKTAPSCCYANWKVPSNTNLRCSGGKIIGVSAPCPNYW